MSINQPEFQGAINLSQVGGAEHTQGPAIPASSEYSGAPSADLPQPEVEKNSLPQLGPEHWHRVSDKYVWADLVLNLLTALIVGGAWLVMTLFLKVEVSWQVSLIMGAATVSLLVYAAFGVRRVRAIGYQLREDDLLFRRGIMFERYVAVPYGRMQLIDIQRGPLLRALGLSTLKFVTASMATGIHLPGLRADEAEQLRDDLVRLAETRRSGL